VCGVDKGIGVACDMDRDVTAMYGAVMVSEVPATGGGGWPNRRDHKTGFKQGVQIVGRGGSSLRGKQ
jgi:hypothetical protein